MGIFTIHPEVKTILGEESSKLILSRKQHEAGIETNDSRLMQSSGLDGLTEMDRLLADAARRDRQNKADPLIKPDPWLKQKRR